MALERRILDKLQELSLSGDVGRASYYKMLFAEGDPYGRLALGVVLQNLMSGRVAYSYAIEVAKRYCHAIDQDKWIELSIALMKADFSARGNPQNYETGKPSLKWTIIRDYHRLAFRDIAHLPPHAWTAWIPLLIIGEAQGAALWRRMLTLDVVTVGVETAGLALQRLAREAGVLAELQQIVTTLLKIAPPVALGLTPRNPAIERCLSRMASQRLQARPGTPGETLAFFYLECLALGAHVASPPFFLLDLFPLTPTHLDPFGPSFTPTLGDYSRAAQP